jgi:hypothetical protein
MSEQENPSPPVKGKRKSLAVMAIIIIAVVVVALAAYWFLIRPSEIPWLFKGAYAKYHGETTVLFVTVKVDMRLEVVDYNSTHAKLLMYVKMDTPLGSREFQNTTWSDLTKKSYEIGGLELKRTYEQETYIEGFGTRKCTVYEYESLSNPGSLMIVYIDKETAWPIKITLTTEATQNISEMSIDLKITESNIPGLKK